MSGIMKTFPFTLGCIFSTGLVACAPASQDQGRVQALGSADRLTVAEWSAYTADQQYVHGLAPTGTRVRLNYADPRQYSFVMARLKLAGKDATNSPHLFEMLESRRQRQIARGMTPGVIAGVADVVAAVNSADRQEEHSIERADPGTGVGAGGTIASSLAGSTFPGGAPYTYVDLAISAKTGRPIGPLAYTEEFDNPNGVPGANVTTATSGDTSTSPDKRYVYESYKLEDRGDGNGLVDSLVRVENGASVAQPRAAVPVLTIPVVGAPVDVNGDNLISICMDRTWTNDCDVVLHGTAQSIQVPLQGSVSVTSAHIFDAAAIQAIKDALNMGQHPPQEGQVKLVLTNVGGGCDVTDMNTLNAQMAPFWNRTTLSADHRTLSWDLTGANAAYFDDGCRQIQDAAKLTVRIPLPLLAVPSGESFLTSITISNDPATQRPDATVLPITLTNSCLAEGTQIQLGDGKLAAVESLHIGQAVFNPYASADHALTIMDTAVGTEAAPMVRIRDDSGRTLLMTEMHPIASADRGMVQARTLRSGDVVMTQQGPTKLVEVTREPYAGKVYNLKVGSQSQMASLGQDQTIVYANGFVVGDGQIQSKYETLALKRGDKPTVAQVPDEWRRDYLMSSARRK